LIWIDGAGLDRPPRRLGPNETVSVYSEADAGELHVELADGAELMDQRLRARAVSISTQ